MSNDGHKMKMNTKVLGFGFGLMHFHRNRVKGHMPRCNSSSSCEVLRILLFKPLGLYFVKPPETIIMHQKYLNIH